MKAVDEYGLKTCAFQADLFRESVLTQECGTRVFVRRFMNSDLASRMDCNGYIFGSTGISEAFMELDEQYGASSYGQVKYGTEEMYWIGYIYRYWSYLYGMSSKQVYRTVKPEELRAVYFPYHSLDPAQAIERIREAKGITDRDDIERGVEIMRRIRSRATV